MKTALQIHYEQPDGASVTLHKKNGVSASYTAGGIASNDGFKWHAELFYANAKLKDGRRVTFFLNRETNLIVVDVLDKDETGGVEILRQTL